MIYDKLTNIGRYKGIDSNLDKAIEYILSHNLQQLPLGKTVIDGDNLYVNVMECETGLIDDKQYEVHQQYMDIQIDLEGVERVITGDVLSMKMGTYDPEGDCSFGNCISLADCIIGSDNFIICMVGEPHMPTVALKQPQFLKKCVFKVHKQMN